MSGLNHRRDSFVNTSLYKEHCYLQYYENYTCIFCELWKITLCSDLSSFIPFVETPGQNKNSQKEKHKPNLDLLKMSVGVPRHQPVRTTNQYQLFPSHNGAIRRSRICSQSSGSPIHNTINLYFTVVSRSSSGAAATYPPISCHITLASLSL